MCQSVHNKIILNTILKKIAHLLKNRDSFNVF